MKGFKLRILIVMILTVTNKIGIIKISYFFEMKANRARERISQLVLESGLIREPPEKFSESRSLFLRYRVKWESVFGAFIFQTSSHRGDGFLVNLNLVCHLFEECPLPSGVFGRETEALSILPERQSSALYNKYFWGGSWLEFEHEPDFMEYLALIIPPSEKWISVNGQALAVDPFLRIGKNLFNDMVDSEERFSIDSIEDRIRLKTAGMEPTVPLRKVAGQLFWKLQGNAKWSQI